MKNLLLLNRPPHKVAAELLPLVGQKFRNGFCLWLLAGLLLLCPGLIQAQTCIGDITLSTQAQVNNFNCSEVTGSLYIEGKDITDLTPLASLNKVKGELYIGNNRVLSSLAGLKNLTSVGEDLTIWNIDNLSSLAGLENLSSVGKNLAIWNIDNLSSLAGLKNLNSVGDNIIIVYNDNLTSLAGLENLTLVSGDLGIGENPQLSQCCLLLSVIRATKGNVNIRNNAANCNSEAEIKAACAPDITAQPQAATLCTGEKATFRVEASGTDLIYQWQKNGQDIVGANASTYTIAAVQDLDADTYTVIVSNTYTSVNSQAATLTVNPLPTPSITAIPTSNVYTGGNPKVIYLGYGAPSVKLQASGGVSYSWRPATGLSNGSMADPVFTPSKAGTYSFTVTATNSSGCEASASVTITVMDVRSGKNLDKVTICHKGQNNSIAPTLVQDHLAHGDKLGDCSGTAPARVSSRSNLLEAEVARQPILKNYPNPFSDQTTLEFTFEEDEEYTLAIYDLAGKLVSQLPGGRAKAGERVQVEWPAARYPTGVYLARLSSSKSVQHLRLVVE